MEEFIKTFQSPPERKAFSVVFQSGRKTQEIIFSDIPGFRGLPKIIKIGRNRRSLVIIDSKSNKAELPWDMLLHLGDPSYPYYRDRIGVYEYY